LSAADEKLSTDGENPAADSPRSGRDTDDASRPARWRKVSSEQLADCRVFRVRHDRSENSRDHTRHDFFVIEAPDWINVIPVTDEGEVVLIEQYRHGVEEISLEIPGGMMDEGESPRDTADRELFEETGYAARELVSLGSTRPNPAIQNNWVHTFLALGAERRGEPANDGTEQTIVRLFPLAEINSLVAQGRINHSLVVAAFHLLALHERNKEN
jgi:8-oxo-dGTP pyrophosphatase MutT (NUDIX family)